MADKRGETAERCKHWGKRTADPDGQCTLKTIEQQGSGGEPLAAGAQHVGRADIARSDRAQIPRAGHSCQD